MQDARPRRVLLVEDQRIVALSEKIILQRAGYDVLLAYSGEAAVRMFRESAHVDLVLMDIDLGPGIDGTVAAQSILAEREVPVVFLSSHTEPEVVDQTERITSYGYIVKTSGETVLLASIRMAFRLFESRIEERTARSRFLHSRDLMSYLIASARSAIAVHDRDLNYLYVSDEYLRAYDVRSADIIGQHHYDVFPDLPQKWRDVHQRSLKGEVVSAEDDPFERADGTLLWTRWECRPWYDADGSIGGIVINTEVTDREQRLRRAVTVNREFVTTLMITTFDGFCVIDGRGSILEANPVLTDLLGYPYDSLITMSVWDITADEDQRAVEQHIERVMLTGTERFCSRLRTSEGSIVAVDVSVSALAQSPRSLLAIVRPSAGVLG